MKVSLEELRGRTEMDDDDDLEEDDSEEVSAVTGAHRCCQFSLSWLFLTVVTSDSGDNIC